MLKYRIGISDEYYIKDFSPVQNLNHTASYFYNNNKDFKNSNKVLIFDRAMDLSFNKQDIKNKDCKFIVDYSFENGLSENDFDKKLSVYSKLGINSEDIIFILNSSAQTLPWITKKTCKILFLDIFAISAVVRCTDYKHPTCQIKVASRPRRLNLLLGKIGKENRARVIYKFYQRKILSFTVAGLLGKRNEIYQTLKIKDDEFYRDIRKYTKSPDKVSTEVTPSGTTSQGWSNSSLVYDKSSVSYICETFDTVDHGNFVTEKTYRPIINKHPFVVHSAPGMIEYLKENGFKTFDKLIDESYDKLEMSENRIDKTIDQSIKLLEHCINNPEHVQNIVDHNYNQLFDRAQHQLNELKKCVNELLT